MNKKQESLSVKALRIFSEKSKSNDQSLEINIDNADKITHTSMNQKSNEFESSSHYFCENNSK